MVSKKKIASATFGAALASMYAAPHLQADILSLDASNFSINTVAESVLGTFISITNVGAGFSAWNGATNAITPANFDQGLLPAAAGDVVTSGFSGAFSGYFNGFTSPGTYFVAFGHAGNAGWFSFQTVDNGAGGQNLVFGSGQYATMGESLTVGVPEPTAGALAALALGAVGVRRNRKK